MAQAKARSALGVFDVLMVEHRDVEALFDQIEALSEETPDQARELFAVLRDSLLGHARAEQAVVYPRLAKIAELADQMKEAEAEHEAVEMLLGLLDSDGADGDEWLARLKVLQENVKHHVHEEEDEIFAIGREKIDEAEAKRLAAQYLQAKARRTGEPELERARGRKPPKRGLVARIVGVFR